MSCFAQALSEHRISHLVTLLGYPFCCMVGTGSHPRRSQRESRPDPVSELQLDGRTSD